MKTLEKQNDQRGGFGSGSLLGRAWDILKAHGEMRGSDLGWELCEKLSV